MMYSSTKKAHLMYGLFYEAVEMIFKKLKAPDFLNAINGKQGAIKQ